MSLHADYLKELKGFSTIEDQFGFVTYGFLTHGEKKYIYIEDIYVVPSKRRSNLASKYADEVVKIGKSMGYTQILGSVVPSLPGAHYRMQVLLGYGFKLHSSQENFIYFIKEF